MYYIRVYMPRHLHSFEVARHHIHIPCPHEHSIRVRRAQARNQSLRVSTGSALHAIPSPLTACQFGKLFFFLRARLRLLCDQLRARTWLRRLLVVVVVVVMIIRRGYAYARWALLTGYKFPTLRRGAYRASAPYLPGEIWRIHQRIHVPSGCDIYIYICSEERSHVCVVCRILYCRFFSNQIGRRWVYLSDGSNDHDDDDDGVRALPCGLCALY